MNETNITPTKVGLRYGVISGLISIVLLVATMFLELDRNLAIGALSVVLWIVFLVLAMKYFKDQNQGFMTLGQGFGIGMLVSVISALLSGLFNILYFRVLSPAAWDKQLDLIRGEWEKAGMDEKTMEMSEKFATPEFNFIVGLIGVAVIGAILSLIVAAIMQKKEEQF